MAKDFSKNITSYDVLKFVAVIIMVIDHMGYYFFPDQLWFRAIGRIGFPVWFFLLGYARGRDVPMVLWAGGAVLAGGNLIAGMYLFPLNALFTIIGIRFLIDRVMRFAQRGAPYLWGMAALLTVLAIPTSFITEYGTQGLLLAMYGYMVRHGYAAGFARDTVRKFMLFTLGMFVACQYVTFGMDTAQMVFMTLGLLATDVILLSFRSFEFAKTDAGFWRVAGWPVRFAGRHTLGIYVWHLLLFKGLAMVLFPAEHQFLQFEWFFI